MSKKRSLLWASVISLTLAAGLLLHTLKSDPSPLRCCPGPQPASIHQSGQSPTRAKSRVLKPTKSRISERIPDTFLLFQTISVSERLDLVTQYMANNRLPLGVLDFFKAEIRNRKHNALIRNNMAHALVYQEKPDPDLHNHFIAMLEDETEELVWRDYCLQFLSEHHSLHR